MIKRRANFQPQLRMTIIHDENAKEIYVRRVSLLALLNQWKEHHIKTKLPRAEVYFIECSMNGHITWQTAKVFTSSELVGRNNVKIIDFKQ
jgi:hypothetical protein